MLGVDRGVVYKSSPISLMYCMLCVYVCPSVCSPISRKSNTTWQTCKKKAGLISATGYDNKFYIGGRRKQIKYWAGVAEWQFYLLLGHAARMTDDLSLILHANFAGRLPWVHHKSQLGNQKHPGRPHLFKWDFQSVMADEAAGRNMGRWGGRGRGVADQGSTRPVRQSPTPWPRQTLAAPEDCIIATNPQHHLHRVYIVKLSVQVKQSKTCWKKSLRKFYAIPSDSILSYT